MPDAPRSNSEKDSIGGWRPKGFISLALDKGYRLGFESSSDHVSTHISYANIVVKGDVTRESLLDGFRKRHADDQAAGLRGRSGRVGRHVAGRRCGTDQVQDRTEWNGPDLIKARAPAT